ncbi:response regulator [Nanoarchaeota archaeon]
MAINFTHQDWQSHVFHNPVLVVDDEDRKLQEMTVLALANGFQPEYARNASEAWSKLTVGNHGYVLMITDNGMTTPINVETGDYDYSSLGGLDKLENINRFGGNEGLQLIRRVRQHPELQGLDIIMYSGSGVGRQAEALGADYVSSTEPYMLNELLRERSALYTDAAANPQTLGQRFLELFRM